MPLDIALMRKWRGDGPESAIVGSVGVAEAEFADFSELESLSVELVE